MPTFTGANSGHTPDLAQGNTGVSNWDLDASTIGDVARILSIGWGGELTTSTGYHTRWVRPTAAGTGAITAIAVSEHSPHGVSALLDFGNNYATLEPALPAEPEALHNQNWNAHGGLGYVALPLASPWLIINGLLEDTVSCRNLAGIDAGGSSYQVTWEE